MPKFEKSQKVKRFADESTQCNQSVLLDTSDPCEPWMLINHAGYETSISVENWKSLIKLSNKVLNEAYPDSELKEN